MRASARRELARDRDREPARDDGRSGTARTGRPVAPRDRLAGPAHRRALRRASAPSLDPASARGSSRTRTSRRRSSSGCCAHAGATRGDLAFGTVDSWLALEAHRRRVHVDRRLERLAHAAARPRAARLGRRAAGPLRRAARGAARGRPRRAAIVGEATLLGATVPVAGHRRRPAGRAVRPGLLRARARRRPRTAPARFVLANAGAASAAAGRRACSRPSRGGSAGEPPTYALEGSRLRRRRGDPVAARRARADRGRGRERGAGAVGRRHRRRLLRPGARPGSARRTGTRTRAALISGLTRGTTPRAPRPRGARGDRLPDARRARRDGARRSTLLRADGGAAANAFLLQFQADLARLPSRSPAERETTALGAAALAGLGAGIWANTAELEHAWRCAARYEPALDEAEAEKLVAGWHDAVPEDARVTGLVLQRERPVVRRAEDEIVGPGEAESSPRPTKRKLSARESSGQWQRPEGERDDSQGRCDRESGDRRTAPVPGDVERDERRVRPRRVHGAGERIRRRRPPAPEADGALRDRVGRRRVQAGRQGDRRSRRRHRDRPGRDLAQVLERRRDRGELRLRGQARTPVRAPARDDVRRSRPTAGRTGRACPTRSASP